MKLYSETDLYVNLTSLSNPSRHKFPNTILVEIYPNNKKKKKLFSYYCSCFILDFMSRYVLLYFRFISLINSVFTTPMKKFLLAIINFDNFLYPRDRFFFDIFHIFSINSIFFFIFGLFTSF